ncbi:MAG: aldo/keto reductase [Thermaceae bacterium]|nr:aldo/keto reductase [Thermaceae bacterium]
MEYVRLGKTGLKVSRICLGMMTYGDPAQRPWSLEQDAAEPFVRRAVEGGINFFDTANVYSRGRSEEITGALLTKYVRREDVIIATKVHGEMGPGPNDRGLSRKHIFDQVEASLKRLTTDYIDLYQIHRWDYTTPIEETMEALHDLVKSGRVRYIGASSMFAWQFAKAQHTADLHGWTRFVSMQNHYNLIYREEEREMNPQCLDMGVGLIPWSPLARGVLTGSRTRSNERLTERSRTDNFQNTLYTDSRDFDIVDRVAEVARERGVSPAQVALAWLLHKPAVTSPIVGASKPQHLEDALNSVELKLSDEEIRRLEELYQPHPVAGHN